MPKFLVSGEIRLKFENYPVDAASLEEVEEIMEEIATIDVVSFITDEDFDVDTIDEQ